MPVKFPNTFPNTSEKVSIDISLIDSKDFEEQERLSEAIDQIDQFYVLSEEDFIYQIEHSCGRAGTYDQPLPLYAFSDELSHYLNLPPIRVRKCKEYYEGFNDRKPGDIVWYDGGWFCDIETLKSYLTNSLNNSDSSDYDFDVFVNIEALKFFNRLQLQQEI